LKAILNTKRPYNGKLNLKTEKSPKIVPKLVGASLFILNAKSWCHASSQKWERRSDRSSHQKAPNFGNSNL